MARLVRCPQCHKLLVEYPNIPVYQCGGCGIALRAKNHNAAAGDNVAQETPQVNLPESQSDNGFSDSGSVSSARETTAKVENEGEENTLPNCNGSPCPDIGDDHSKLSKNTVEEGGCSSPKLPLGRDDTNYDTQDQPVELIQEDESYGSHEQAENPVNLDEVDQPSYSASHSIASEEELADRAQSEGLHDVPKSPATIISSHAYDGGISSSDEAHSVCTPNRQAVKSRRTFRTSYSENRLKSRSVASSSSNERRGARAMTRFSDEIGRGSSFDSGEFQSVENWMALQKDSPAGDLHDKAELLRKIDEVRDHLAKIYVASEEREVYPSRGIHGLQQLSRRSHGDFYDHPTKASCMQAKKYQHSLKHFPQHVHCTCLHCVGEQQMAANLHGHGSYRANSAHKLDSHSSSSGSSRRSQFKDKAKHHCRPISGAAPFVICENCNKLLQLPADFLVTKRRMYKLQCGGCKEVLSLPFPATSRNPSQAGSPSQDHQEDVVSDEPERVPNLSNNSFEGRDVKALRLHRLLGYASASDLLYEEDGDIGNGYENMESVARQSHIASTSDGFRGRGNARPGIPRPGMTK
ncbi:hypothetical protein Cni_G05432 [Canna indica]|uniref:Zinc-ribbon domain-containing protein n=1 Tax=Canna indica TaxID=4628 RepID=A0AAQ3JZ76_9LILI|nr:hypothetical protein Cni_G05432 [Canna indica]